MFPAVVAGVSEISGWSGIDFERIEKDARDPGHGKKKQRSRKSLRVPSDTQTRRNFECEEKCRVVSRGPRVSM